MLARTDYYQECAQGVPNGGIMRAADQLLGVLGNGMEWHKNGWCSDTPDIDPKKNMKIPVFNAPFMWYGFDEYCMLAYYAGVGKPLLNWDVKYMNDSFLNLAFNILQCAIRYPHLTCHDMQGKGNNLNNLTKEELKQRKKLQKKSMEWTKNIFFGLARKFPDKVPDFCKDL